MSWSPDHHLYNDVDHLKQTKIFYTYMGLGLLNINSDNFWVKGMNHCAKLVAGSYLCFCQVSPQLSGGNIGLIWTWHSASKYVSSIWKSRSINKRGIDDYWKQNIKIANICLGTPASDQMPHHVTSYYIAVKSHQRLLIYAPPHNFCVANQLGRDTGKGTGLCKLLCKTTSSCNGS